jgi:hypothetical protein
VTLAYTPSAYQRQAYARHAQILTRKPYPSPEQKTPSRNTFRPVCRLCCAGDGKVLLTFGGSGNDGKWIYFFLRLGFNFCWACIGQIVGLRPGYGLGGLWRKRWVYWVYRGELQNYSIFHCLG